jgi:two-component system chemotaxis response regulator CheB
VKRDIVVIGASAGGVEALTQLAAGLDGSFEGSTAVVLHLTPYGPSFLPQILERASGAPSAHPFDGEPLRAGRIYPAPPDHHLVLESERVRLTRDPEHNRHRPSIDVLFHSAARVFGPRAIGVLLSGADDDGVSGLAHIRRARGVTIVQDPCEAAFPTMPQSALQRFDPDWVLPAAEIGLRLAQMVKEDVAPGGQPAETEPSSVQPAGFACPDCGGPLTETRRGGEAEYRCIIGHSYTAEGLVRSEAENLDRALWAAVRILEDGAAVSRRVAALMEESSPSRELYEQRARVKEEHARVIRSLIQDAAARQHRP